MRGKRGLAGALAALWILASGWPLSVQAVDEVAVPQEEDIFVQAEPTFRVEWMADAPYPGLYGTMDAIPEDTTCLAVEYSLDGATYFEMTVGEVYPDEYGVREWDLTGLGSEEGAALTQLCAGNLDAPLKAYLEESINTLFVRLRMERSDGVQTTESVKLSHEKSWPAPEEAPPFTARVAIYGGTYLVVGQFDAFAPDVIAVTPMYSEDGASFQPAEEFDWNLCPIYQDGVLTRDTEQSCMNGQVEPLEHYLAGAISQFYLKLRLTKETGETYDTQVAVIARGEPQPVPEGASVRVRYPSNMRNSRPPYGKYQITVSEGTTWEELSQRLPNQLPLEVQIELPGEPVPAMGEVTGEVTWTLPEGLIEEQEVAVVPGAAVTKIVPGQTMETPFGVFQLENLGEFSEGFASDELRLYCNIVSPDAAPTGALSESYDYRTGANVLSLVFDHKPSGAEEIHVYSFAEGEEAWTEWSDRSLLEAAHGNPGGMSSDYAAVLSESEGQYRAYRAGEIEGFLIGIRIEGGVYDGQELMLPWPGSYELPVRVPEMSGSGGNENNAGSDGGSSSEDSGGQHPSQPGEDQAPAGGGNNSSGGSGNDGSSGGGGDVNTGSSGGNNSDSSAENPTPSFPETPEMPAQSEPEQPTDVVPEETPPSPEDPTVPETMPEHPRSTHPADLSQVVPNSDAAVGGATGDTPDASAGTPEPDGGQSPDAFPEEDTIPVFGPIQPAEQSKEKATSGDGQSPEGQDFPVGTAVVLVGGVAATVAIGAAVAGGAAATGGAVSTGVGGKLLAVIRKLFLRT